MTPPNLRHRRTSWVTLVTLVLATLAPAVSHSLSRVRAAAAPWDEVCTTRGNTHKGFGGPGPVAPLGHHCAFCATHGGALGPPPALVGSVDAPALSLALTLRALSAPSVQAAWSSAQPRAPPWAG
ncbi:DUF2946 domain-containing protein [Ideonella sp. A 288]|uniref:DUF2946 domain-containing protein n=1 Tax=Ideonella sp. A 288 TaxID=1962181 RepID=UPI000B4BE06E|nr:DUF2946 domain-containing protein [Ideonella sp. A 288]